jgi:hypothetical protein
MFLIGPALKNLGLPQAGAFTIKVIVPVVKIVLAVVHVYLETAVCPSLSHLDGPTEIVLKTASHPDQHFKLLTEVCVRRNCRGNEEDAALHWPHRHRRWLNLN